MRIDALIDRSRGHGHAHRMRRRVVIRIEVATIARIDALLLRFPDSSRASLIRAFCLLGVGVAEEHVKATPSEGEATS